MTRPTQCPCCGGNIPIWQLKRLEQKQLEYTGYLADVYATISANVRLLRDERKESEAKLLRIVEAQLQAIERRICRLENVATTNLYAPTEGSNG